MRSTGWTKALVTARKSMVGLAALAASVAVPVGRAGAVAPGINGKIACESSREGNSEIFLIDPDGSNQTNITHTPLRDGDPSWAPDGKRLAYENFNFNAASEAARMNAGGGEVTRLTFDGGPEDRGTSWAPDNRQITFHINLGGGHSFDVFKMNDDGSNQVNLTPSSPAQDSAPAWSPLGDKIVFNTNRDAGDFEIYSINPDGSSPTRLTNSPGEDSGPNWSPDGSQIVFQSRRTGDLEIWRMNADGSNPVQLTHNPGDPFTSFDAFPTWSPDGTRIAWTSGRDDNGLELYTMNAIDGSDVRQLTFNTAFTGRCDWGRLACTVSGAGAIVGTPGDDVICGSNGPDNIDGGGGNDLIWALGGDDTVQGGPGSTIVFGGSGRDRIYGGGGTDWLYGEDDDDLVFGPAAARIDGGLGADLCQGASETFNC